MPTAWRTLGLPLAALLLQAPPAPAAAQARFDFDRTPGTLPRSVLAPRQALVLDLHPERDRFEGETTLTLTLRRPQQHLLLHAHRLTAQRSVLVTATGERELSVQPDEKTQTWRLLPVDGRPVPAGKATLRLAWSGVVQPGEPGLFRAIDKADGGTPRRMLATQLEAVYARTLFPAFDEPAFRTRFDITVRTPPGFEVLSNMPLRSTRADGGRLLHHFAPTPPMPSYLVSVAVGRFDVLAGRAAGVPLRILSTPGKREQGAYALAATQKVLPYYSAYFGQRFALPKLDQLAVPSGRNSAMEDWGLISYPESGLLFDPATGHVGQQRRIFNLLAHEVAHQWFGNLVTAASWEEIWLNEAFAEWMADKVTDRFNPQWQQRLRQRRSVDPAMTRDGGTATRAIRSGPVPEDRVFDVFDNITYAKGGAVLGMLEQWMGEDVFRRGLQAYMKARRMSNATAGDLWFHIGREAQRNVAAVAATWTDQPGFPVVDVDSRCEAGRTQVDLAQRPFSLDGTPRPGLWQIPLELQQGGRSHRTLLSTPRLSLTLPGCAPQPVVLNPQGVGFYRVANAPALQAQLARSFLQLPADTQITLLSDTFALAQAGALPMAAWLDLVAQLPRTQGPAHAALLAQAQDGLRQLGEVLHDTPAAAALATAVQALLGPELQALGWEARAGEDSETQSMRSALIRDLAQLGDPAVLARARALFDDDEAGRSPLPASIRSAVITAVGWGADAGLFDVLQRRLLQARSEADRWLYAEALARVPDATLMRQVLALSLGDTLPVNLSTRLPGLVAGARLHREAAYQHVVEHWALLAARAGDVFGARAWLLPGAAWGFNTEAGVQRLLDDQRRLAGDAGAAIAQRAVSRIRLTAAMQQREATRIVPALEALAAQAAGDKR